MKLKLLVVFSSFILFTSCELMQSLKMSAEVLKKQPACVWENASEANECNVEYWLKFWCEIEGFSCPERKKKIEQLSEQDADVLKKILLSLGKSTPFQARLRAQGWVESILPKFSPKMRRFILVALYYPSQDLLEMESALVMLGKINAH